MCGEFGTFPEGVRMNDIVELMITHVSMVISLIKHDYAYDTIEIAFTAIAQATPGQSRWVQPINFLSF